MSENLTRLAQRIDFSKDVDETQPSSGEKPEVVADSDAKELISFQPSLWPWDSVRSKLRLVRRRLRASYLQLLYATRRNAFTEISVLLDVLNITKDRRYMVLDPVQQDPTDFKPAAALIAKKKALGSTALIILNGAKRLQQSQSDTTRNRAANFHTELMTMRQSWRMRKVANAILGDLSYRSGKSFHCLDDILIFFVLAGSRYPHLGTFEISKNEVAALASPSTPSSGAVARPCALKVTIPADLEGVCYIHVTIQKSKF